MDGQTAWWVALLEPQQRLFATKLVPAAVEENRSAR